MPIRSSGDVERAIAGDFREGQATRERVMRADGGAPATGMIALMNRTCAARSMATFVALPLCACLWSCSTHPATQRDENRATAPTTHRAPSTRPDLPRIRLERLVKVDKPV